MKGFGSKPDIKRQGEVNGDALTGSHWPDGKRINIDMMRYTEGLVGSDVRKHLSCQCNSKSR